MTESEPQKQPEDNVSEQEAPVLTRRQQLRKKGIYLIPNLFTLAALFGGFYAIVMAMGGQYELAAVGIFCAMVLDSFDGRVARLTGTASEFGEQMDSLSDMVSFGAAPALVVYTWALNGLGKVGWIVAFVYCACGALRLARFNTNIGVVDKRYFQGLPSPAAAAIVAGFVWAATYLGFSGDDVNWLALLLTLYAGLSMVTNIPFYSFKVINFRKLVPFSVLVLIALVIALIAFRPALVLFGIFLCYGVSGYVCYFRQLLKGNKISAMKKPSAENIPAETVEENDKNPENTNPKE